MTSTIHPALSKYLAQSGYCSRRAATELIKSGKVKINGRVITTPFTPVLPQDLVTAQGQEIKPTRKIYLLFNKPKGLICSAADDKQRKTVCDIFTSYFQERLYPIGRLDRATTGLLIMTNDGDLTQRLAHPKYQVQKIYKVSTDRNITKKSLEDLLAGIKLEDGFMKVNEAYYPTESKKTVHIALHSGKNQIVRRLFKALGYDDIKLDRINYAGLTKKDLPVRAWRHLTEAEIKNLYQYEKESKDSEQHTKKEAGTKSNRALKAKKYYARL